MTGETRAKVHREFQRIINNHSLENDSNTPDFLLADYLIFCLDAWNSTTGSRDQYYGRKPASIPVSQWPKYSDLPPHENEEPEQTK